MKRVIVTLFCFAIASASLAQDCSDNGGTSPIVINFAAGGYSLSGQDSFVEFDIAATGHPLRIGWTAAGANEAFLALDRNGNGLIDDGAELFGNATPAGDGQRARNGFLALLPYDDDHNAVIDERDAIWSFLLLWCDQNHDAISQSWELRFVSASALTAIELTHHWTGRRDAFGNVFRYESRVLVGGEGEPVVARPVYDIFFVRVP